MKKILIRKGVNGFRYSACKDNGEMICNAQKISDITSTWRIEKKLGQVEFVRQLHRKPKGVHKTERIEEILREIARKTYE